jgi:hypothetical protein
MMATSDQDVPRLVVTEPTEHAGRVLALSRPEVLIGHSGTANIILDEQFVSGLHALISIDSSGQVTIRDLNSSRGTFVNEEPITGSLVLQPGDLVRFSNLVARFEPGNPVLVEVEEDTIIDVTETGPATQPSKRDDDRGTARIILVDEDGEPVAGTRVSLFAQAVRGERQLGAAVTGRKGQCTISYRRPRALNLMARAYDRTLMTVAQSSTYFAAPAQIQINFTTAADGMVRTPSIYTTLSTGVAEQLRGIPLSSLEENSDTHELQFLASALAVNFDEVAYLYIAQALGTQNGIRTETFFGILSEGLPASLGAALANLPDSGIDDTFTAQVLSGILGQSDDSLNLVLTDAISANVLPFSYGAAQASELALLGALRTTSVAQLPYIRGKTSLNDLLAAGGVSTAVQAAFTSAYAASNGQLGPTWTALRANSALPAAALATLDTTLSLGELLAGNLPLVTDSLSRLSQGTLGSIQNLALLDQSDWVARITAVDPKATSIPQVMPNDTPAERITRFAKALTERFSGRFPTTAFAGSLSKAEASSFGATKEPVVSFLVGNPTFTFKRTNIDHFLVTSSIAMPADALADLKTAQRLFRISPHYTTVDALKAAGHQSAQSVYFQGRDAFVAAMTEPFGSASLATMAYARAHMVYATALTAYSSFNGAFNGSTVAAMGSTSPDPGTLANLPDLQALFGSLDYFQCEDCQSVYSPAAYLVDLLQYLAWFTATGGGVGNARDALLLRRPDIENIALDCANTNTTLPYIDLVNELLEAAIAPPASPATVIDTTGTSAERRAVPQQISQAAYAATAQAVFPLCLPFDLAFAQTQAYLKALGITRAAVLARFAGNPVVADAAPAIAAAALGINPEMQTVINGTDAHQPWERWGLAQNPASVIDPVTREPYTPNPADWVAALSKVPVLLNRTGLTLQQLYQLLEVIWVTQSGVTLQAGTMTVAGLQLLSPDTDEMSFTGLTADVLDRANRFLRLWTASGLQMWELDWALEEAPAGALNADFLVFLSSAIAVQGQLGLPFQEVLSFWMPLETRDVIDHLGDEDTVTPSTYTEVFRNAAVLASASGIFVPVGQSTVTGASNASPIAITTVQPHGYQTRQQVNVAGALGNTAANGTFTITVTGPASFTLDGSAGNGDWTAGGTATGVLSGNPVIGAGPPTAEQNAITASLGLSADDVSAILAFTGAANALSLDTLNVLLRYQRLASACSLQVSDLILWMQLTSGQPFGAAPADTLEFCRRLAVLQGTGLGVHDLDYLLRDQSASQSSLTFTQAQATTVLQAIANAIAKLPAPAVIAVTGASDTAPITISTALANGLQTGAQVSITGALGNTAANATFTITVTSATTFTLDDSAGNGAWSGGGSITVNAYDATTIETIFVAALATATSVTADVVTPVLLAAAILPLDPATISLLLAQGSSVDPTKFPALVSAFTAVAKAAALYTALNPTATEFAFAVQAAGSYGWLDPSALPLVPVSASPYAQFEALITAFRLDRRQPARAPKLFDILAQWLLPGSLPPDVPTAVAGPTLTIIGASDASPIAVDTATPHGLQTGEQVTISGVAGNTAANGTFTVTVTGPSSLTLDGSAGSGAWTSGGSVSQPALAFALGAGVVDVQALAAALGATAPGFSPATRPGSLADVAMLAAIAGALDITVRYGVSGATLVQLAAAPATAQAASAAIGAFQAQYGQTAWLTAIQPIEDALRETRRDALVAYMLGPGPAGAVPLMLTTDDIYNYYLIDPEMSSCALMTRLLQASLAIQQFVQQCFLNLTIGGITVDTADSRWSEWSWRHQYRLWQAAREVFLYPENYVLPELRTDASSFFTDLENDMRQSNADEDAAEAAMQNYLRKLVGVANLKVAAHYNQARADGTYVLHVFARTQGDPAQWYYRIRTGSNPESGSWSAWQSLSLDITSEHVLPVIWDQRLYLIWPVFKQISEKQSSQSVPASGGGSQPPAQKFWSVELAMSQLSAGQWQAKQTLPQKLYWNTADSPKAFTFRAAQDPQFNLQLQAYFVAIEDVIAQAIAQADLKEVQVAAQQALGGIFGGIFGGAFGGLIGDTYSFYVSELGSNASVKLSWPKGSPQIVLTSSSAVSGLATQATLPMPDSPLSVIEVPLLLPGSQYMDLSQDPTYALISTSPLSGSLATPAKYGFDGQYLVYGNYTLGNPGSVPLNVLCLTSAKGQPGTVELLARITNPRITVPPQEPVFDSTDPFFVADPTRTYLVQPTYYTVSSSPAEITNLAYINQWSTRFVFESFYHPYARTFLRELEIGGVPQLMSRNLQLNPQSVRGWTPAFDFNSIYDPQSPVAKPYPGTAGAPDPGESALDFAVGDSGAYSLYNWEVFYHVPMFIASLLLQNQQFSDALTWLEYIFNPTDSSGGAAPQRYWEMAPFNAMNTQDWINQQIQNLLTVLAADTQQGISDGATATAIQNWMSDPYDPHAVARVRIAAYGKATVMRFLDTLIAWGDWYYSQYTAEMVSYAEQLYVLADMILGPAPQELRLPDASQSGAETVTYASLKNVDLFSNALVSAENVVVAPEPPQSVVQGTAQLPSLPQFPGRPGQPGSLLFCVPPNDQLLGYWGTVAQRLYNIRHCLNLQGQPQPLPLYAPAINPLALIEEQAAGAAFSGGTPSAPVYRFSVYLQKAIELTNDVRSYGALILSALEKQDAETLAVLRANQELDIQTRLLDVKTEQVTEAQDQITALQNQQAVVQVRYNFYSSRPFMNASEIAALGLQNSALSPNGTALTYDIVAMISHMIPSFSVGIAGFGGTPTVSMSMGGENSAGAAASMASNLRGQAGLLSEQGGIAATMGGYQRRMDDWTMQAQLASAEITQVSSQITAAQDRLTIAQKELDIQSKQIANAQAISDFLTGKYTNAQLYNWMITQLTTVFAQAYQLAFALALQAQNAYQYELGSQDTFIQFGYWDSQHKGLTSGESLLFDLRRMEAQYLAENNRELELTKHVSLALTSPVALVMLRETGTCQIALDEVLFEFDHPGQFYRRLRSVALTIPCVTGPYTGVNATLSLSSAMIRTQSPGTSYQPQSAAAAPNDPSVIVSPVAAAGTQTIATSTGQADSGLFEANLRDERWLPFEGQGAISTWNLVLDPRDNNFDITTITDVILHVRYTARGGGDQTAADNVRAKLKPSDPRPILVSVRNTFPDSLYTFFNPPAAGTGQTLSLPLVANVFPYTNLGDGTAEIQNIALYLVLTVPAEGNTIPADFSGSTDPISLAPMPGQTTAGEPINALAASVAYAPALAVPQTLSLTVPSANVPPALGTTVNEQTVLDPAKVEDVLLVITYSIG